MLGFCLRRRAPDAPLYALSLELSTNGETYSALGGVLHVRAADVLMVVMSSLSEWTPLAV